MAQERTGVVSRKGMPVTLLGPEIKVGDKAPDFKVLDMELQEFDSKTIDGSVRIYSVVPSLDPSVCDKQTRRFNEAAKGNLEILTISVDLPYAQRRWCKEKAVDKIRVLSDHKDLFFGYGYGVLIKEQRLLTRAVFVVDQDGIVRHAEYVRDTSNEPNYERALEIAESLVKTLSPF